MSTTQGLLDQGLESSPESARIARGAFMSPLDPTLHPSSPYSATGRHQGSSSSKRSLEGDSDESDLGSSSEDEQADGNNMHHPSSDALTLSSAGPGAVNATTLMKDFDREILTSMVNDQIKKLKLDDKSAARLCHFARYPSNVQMVLVFALLLREDQTRNEAIETWEPSTGALENIKHVSSNALISALIPGYLDPATNSDLLFIADRFSMKKNQRNRKWATKGGYLYSSSPIHPAPLILSSAKLRSAKPPPSSRVSLVAARSDGKRVLVSSAARNDDSVFNFLLPTTTSVFLRHQHRVMSAPASITCSYSIVELPADGWVDEVGVDSNCDSPLYFSASTSSSQRQYTLLVFFHIPHRLLRPNRPLVPYRFIPTRAMLPAPAAVHLPVNGRVTTTATMVFVLRNCTRTLPTGFQNIPSMPEQTSTCNEVDWVGMARARRCAGDETRVGDGNGGEVGSGRVKQRDGGMSIRVVDIWSVRLRLSGFERREGRSSIELTRHDNGEELRKQDHVDGAAIFLQPSSRALDTSSRRVNTSGGTRGLDCALKGTGRCQALRKWEDRKRIDDDVVDKNLRHRRRSVVIGAAEDGKRLREKRWYPSATQLATKARPRRQPQQHALPALIHIARMQRRAENVGGDDAMVHLDGGRTNHLFLSVHSATVVDDTCVKSQLRSSPTIFTMVVLQAPTSRQSWGHCPYKCFGTATTASGVDNGARKRAVLWCWIRIASVCVGWDGTDEVIEQRQNMDGFGIGVYHEIEGQMICERRRVDTLHPTRSTTTSTTSTSTSRSRGGDPSRRDATAYRSSSGEVGRRRAGRNGQGYDDDDDEVGKREDRRGKHMGLGWGCRERWYSIHTIKTSDMSSICHDDGHELHRESKLTKPQLRSLFLRATPGCWTYDNTNMTTTSKPRTQRRSIPPGRMDERRDIEGRRQARGSEEGEGTDSVQIEIEISSIPFHSHRQLATSLIEGTLGSSNGQVYALVMIPPAKIRRVPMCRGRWMEEGDQAPFTRLSEGMLALRMHASVSSSGNKSSAIELDLEIDATNQLRSSIVDEQLDLFGVETVDFDVEVLGYIQILISYERTHGGIFTTPEAAYTMPVEMWIKALGKNVLEGVFSWRGLELKGYVIVTAGTAGRMNEMRKISLSTLTLSFGDKYQTTFLANSLIQHFSSRRINDGHCRYVPLTFGAASACMERDGTAQTRR
ncbi:hypothetical protein SCHPADRAFT_891931 [Schizopora paradoxa]|uniref:Uncharacterized protein n=1 Tax=Schizopora paradoxa TaxID=27342 RepID=A0A0H2S206_9AGAM|nr:hypothetical protein SCHPADRAFT_891931 [Schizopora paradoxa]